MKFVRAFNPPGAEMVYILVQRLAAQDIYKLKSQQVIDDVVKTMFNEAFVSELFKPQATYSKNSTRQIFEKLAHSSIMKLNKGSMSKLYDLMVMALKYQMLWVSSAEEMYAVTVRHLEKLKELVGPTRTRAEEPREFLKACLARVRVSLGALPLGEWAHLQRELATFLQSEQIKITLFLSTGLQAADGTLALPIAGPLPRFGQAPGAVRTFRDGRLTFEGGLRTSPGAGSCFPPSRGGELNKCSAEAFMAQGRAQGRLGGDDGGDDGSP
eukprot:CAMPEP_0172600822 /NCGR_PEP_ID=MMETSP1068-20121228/20982_1 /TAXON_ID=35684 /ORGANISM="Pseudopedinella elastica, Strain CCMP716" /LENGTH=268 /DNA_ID=CAMNT_0013401611 /DNA_START=127 /DNA_END=930 /DNA_ORIENTATION=+